MTGTVGVAVSLNDTGSYDPDAGDWIVSYKWTFGDHKRGKGRKVSHVFKRRGKYKVTLVIRDAAGHTAKVRHTVKVR